MVSSEVSEMSVRSGVLISLVVVEVELLLVRHQGRTLNFMLSLFVLMDFVKVLNQILPVNLPGLLAVLDDEFGASLEQVNPFSFLL